MKTMKRFGLGVLVGFVLATLFSAPWIYQAYAVGNCSVFRSWNTGDSVTASDLNSSFTTAAVTNSTLQCVDDYSSTVSQMQSTTDPYASGTESQATTAAGEIERLRFMFKQMFGLSQWYRHDQAPMFTAGHIAVSSLHLAYRLGPGGTDAAQQRFQARFPELTGPDHWTGIWFPHNTAHMAFSFRDYQHANGGTQGGIELYRFHAEALTMHHLVTLRFRHSAQNGSFPHVTALAIDSLDRIVVGHSGVALILHGASLSGEGGTSKVLFLSAQGHVYTNTIASGSGASAVVLSPMNAILPHHAVAFPGVAKHQGATISHFALMYSDINHQWAHWQVAMPSGATAVTMEIWSAQGRITSGHIGWHVQTWTVGPGENPDQNATHTYIFYPVAVPTNAGKLTKQTETITGSYDGAKWLYVSIRRTNTGSASVGNHVNGFSFAAEHTAFRGAVIRFQ